MAKQRLFELERIRWDCFESGELGVEAAGAGIRGAEALSLLSASHSIISLGGETNLSRRVPGPCEAILL